MRADRLLRIVQLLRRHGRVSSTELARTLEVSRRTVLRDMDALSAAGIPVYAEHGRSGGFALVEGYEPDLDQLTSDEARALFVVGGHGVADALGLGPHLGRALGKLSTALPDEEHRRVRHLQDRVVLDAGGWVRDPEDVSHLPEVQEAVLGDERIRIRYQSKGATAPGERTVDPWGLLQAGTTWYLIAAHRGRPRSYRVSRISGVVPLGEVSLRPQDLDLRGVWQQMRAEFRDVTGTPLVLRVHRARLPMVMRSLSVVLVGDPEPLGEGRIRLMVRSLRGAAAMLLGFGDEVEVISPDELREEMVALAEHAGRHHARRPAPFAAP